jgi:hypothetical protein
MRRTGSRRVIENHSLAPCRNKHGRWINRVAGSQAACIGTLNVRELGGYQAELNTFSFHQHWQQIFNFDLKLSDQHIFGIKTIQMFQVLGNPGYLV